MRHASAQSLPFVAFLTLLSGVISNGRAEDAPPAKADVIWIEGESAARKTISKHGWYDGVKKDTLSGQDWLSHFDERKEGSAEFDFQVEQADSFAFWLRANPVAAKLSYKLDDKGDWQLIDLNTDQRELLNIANDNKPDLRFITWVKVGTVKLTAGKHTIAFRMHSGPQNHGAIDCFVFTRIPFVPSGAQKPLVRSGRAAPDEWFPVVLDDDPLSSDSVIDISRLVDAPAGKFGSLKRQGAAFQFEKAKLPVKFWAVGASPRADWTPQQMTLAAKWYRKHGINMVRQHTVIDTVGLLDAQGRFDPQRLDHYDRWFASMKDQGIYTTWSVVYPHHGAFLQKTDAIDPKLFAELDALDTARDGNRGPIASNDFINLDRSIQDVAWKYFDTLLKHVNPYTKLAYQDDPALAVLEVQNESNVFFYTLAAINDPQKAPILSRRMRTGFFEFVKNKYKNQKAVDQAWGGRSMPGDDWSRGELALMAAYHWGSDGPLHEYAGQPRRTGDYIEFLTKLQREYFERRVKQMRDAGFKGVTVTTAWKSGGPAAEMANLYSDTAADAIDRHNYFGGGAGGHGIIEGEVDNKTHLDRPGHGLLALSLFQVENHPFIVTELIQSPPNPWKAEAAPLYAFYGMGLQGWDATYSFGMGGFRMGNGWRELSAYVIDTPHYMGQFPALAFAVHQGHIREGEVIAARHVSPADMFSGKDPLGQSLAGGGFDAKELVGRLTTPPSAAAIGRVTIDFDNRPTKTRDFSSYHNQQTRTLTSTTGDLVWHYGERYVEVRSPKTQGIIGFAGGKSIELPGVKVKDDTPFVSVLFTP
ncbi:MAG: Endo-beta-mannanase, partial [Planctomycetaceae bacterium]|nr:Endo-beta-mannanase [Planctomycetaceae bacterium]